MEYFEIDLDDLEAGQSALMLFAREGVLVGCLIERHRDGQLHHSSAASVDSRDFVRLLSTLYAALRDGAFKVVIGQGGYWPEQFPAIRRIQRSSLASQ